jgi:hypothetical protein
VLFSATISGVSRCRSDVRRAWRAALACATLAFYLLVAVVPFERLVLCVRPGGHVGLEVGGRNMSCLDCGQAGKPVSEEGGCCTRSEASSGDAPCRDIVLLQHEDEPGIRPTTLDLPGLQCLALTELHEVVVGVASPTPCRVERQRFEPPRPPPFQLAQVLRI